MELIASIVAVVLSALAILVSSITWALTRIDRRRERENKVGYREADRLALEKREEQDRLSREKQELKEDLRQIDKKLDDALGRLSRLEGAK